MAELTSIRVITADRIPLDLPAAGLGERGFAYFVDVSIVIGSAMAALFVYNFWGDIEQDVGALSPIGSLIALAVLGAIVVGYDVLFEVFAAGQTPGKRFMRIRVVDAQGQAPDVVTSMLRNALRIVDFLPAFYAAGTVSLFVTGDRRLGDLVSGCAVVKDRPAESPVAALSALARKGPVAKDSGRADEGESAPVCTDDQAEKIEAFWVKSATLTPAARDKAAARFVAREGIALSTSDSGANGVARYYLGGQRRRGSRVWRALMIHDAAARLNESVETFTRSPTDGGAQTLDDAVRTLSATLSQHEARIDDRVKHAAAVALLAAERVRSRGPAQTQTRPSFWRTQIPMTLYAERALIVRCAVVLFSAAGLAFAMSYADPNIARALLGQDLSTMIDAGAQWTNRIEAEGQFSRAAITVILNNVRVGFLACGFGLLGGLGTLLLLGANGLHLGAVFGYAVQQGEAATLLKFIAAHGPVELLSVCVAGAAGLAIGRALVRPGPFGRVAALRREGQVAARLLVAATVGFLLIGTVEGLISPGQLFPWPVNAGIGALSLVAVLSFISRVGGRAARTTTAPSP